jgi:GT2 family glycosyltransferase
MELSIIITSYRNPELLKVCLDSIKKNFSGGNYEIIVVDSQTQEDTELMMREEYPEIKFFPFAKNIGFQELVKKGINESQGDFFLILNGDIIVKKDSIEGLLKFIQSHPEAGMVGPQLINFNGTLQYSCSRFYKPLTIIYRRTFLGRLPFAKKHLDWFLMMDYDHASVKEVDWLMGSALLVSRKAVEKVGLMDPRYFMYFEDVDWCRRFWENGYKVIYYPLVNMHHYHGRGSAGKNTLFSIFFNWLTRMHILSALKYFLKYLGKPLPKHN